jgi:hypothetical protein
VLGLLAWRAGVIRPRLFVAVQAGASKRGTQGQSIDPSRVTRAAVSHSLAPR